MSTPRFITSLQKHTGTTRSEAITVISIAIVLAAGTLGPMIFSTPSLHEVATADRILAILDSANKAAAKQADGMYASGSSDSGTIDEFRSSQSRSAYRANGHSLSTNAGVLSKGSVNINTASAAQLERLPGVGPATAQAIIKRRTTRPFKHIDDLMDIRGIGPKKFEKMRGFVVCTTTR